MDYPEDRDELHIFDFASGYDPDFIRTKEWGIGRYNEKRSGMYVAPQYKNERDIHMGIDIWTQAGAPVFSFYKGEVAYLQDNNQPGNYGPTMVIRYQLDDTELFALYGHLSRPDLARWEQRDPVNKGEQIAKLGTETVNGGWAPHLHFQLSVNDPGEADMPGVVAEENRAEAMDQYPDPRKILGAIY